MNLNIGDILLCRRETLLSKLIRKFTKSKYNHVAIYVEVWGEPFIIDAQAKGVNAISYEQWLKKYKYRYTVYRHNLADTECFKKDISIRAFSKIGFTGYDVLSLVWYQPRYIFTGKWKGKRNEDAIKRMYCSEYVAWVYELPNWWKLSPEDLYVNLQNNKNFKFIKNETNI
jgi:hypothetical protein